MALLPTSARSQNQSPVAAPQQEKAAEVQTPQKPVEVIIPEPVAEPAEVEQAPQPDAAAS